MELAKYEQELEDRSEKIVADLTHLVNSMSFKPDYFIDAMSREHRTLQQSFTKLCMQWLEHVAHDGYPYDLRNEASHQVCRDIVKLYVSLLENKSNALPSQMLPLI